LVDETARAAAYPTGSSLAYALYKLLPNDTDFTLFRPVRTPGLNFAFGGRLEAYHSGLDTADNLDTASLQHHGSYALSLARRFGQMDLSTFKQQGGDDVFFDWLGSNLIVYSARWVVIGEVAATILLLLAVVLSARRVEMRIRSFAAAVGVCLVVLLIIPVTMTAAGWLILRLLDGRMLLGDTPSNSLLLIGLTLLGAAVGCGLVAQFRRRFHLRDLTLAGLAVVLTLSWIAALLLPAGSYVLFWPLLLTTIGLLVVELFRAESSHAQLLGTVAGAGTAILLFAPLGYIFFVFLTLTLPTIAAVGLLLGLFFIIGMPLVYVGAPQPPWRTIVLPLLAAAGIFFALGIQQSRWSAQHPRPDTLVYSLNADDRTAVWASFDKSLDGYTAQFIRGKTPKPQPIPNYLTGLARPVLSGPAPVIDLNAPIVEIKRDEQEGDFHKIHMNVRSQRDAYVTAIRFDPSVKLVSVKVSGRSLSPRPNSAGPIYLCAMGAQGADMELTLHGPSGVSFWVSDRSVGLPTTLRRTPDFIDAPGSDETLACRKYVLGKAGK